MKKLLLILAALQLAVAPVPAVITISFSQNPSTGPIFVTSSFQGGVPVPDGSLVRIGTFAAEPNAGGNLNTDFNSFQEFTTTTIGRDNTPDSDGILLRGGSSGIAGPDSFAGQSIYIWVYNTPTATPGSEQGIYRSMGDAGPNVFPAPDQPTTTTFSVTQFTSAYGTLVTPAAVTFPVPGGGGPVPRMTLTLAGVPEPSAAVMLLAAAGLLVRRRRA